MIRQNMRPRILTSLLSVTLYIASLFCGVFVLAGGHSDFIIGFVCALFGFEKFAWYANPLLFASHVTLLKKCDKLTVLISGSALVVAGTTLLITEMPKDEAGNMETVIGYQSGFYLWLASIAVIFVAAIWNTVVNKSAHSTSLNADY